jgi:hypothetical protein
MVTIIGATGAFLMVALPMMSQHVTAGVIISVLPAALMLLVFSFFAGGSLRLLVSIDERLEAHLTQRS